MKAIFFFVALISVKAIGQNNFSYSPAQPNAGDNIEIRYKPTGLLLSTSQPVEAVAYYYGIAEGDNQKLKAEELKLIREGEEYTTTIKTHPAHNFIYFRFSAGELADGNNNEGYYILLNEKGEPKKGSLRSAAQFYLVDILSTGGLKPDYSRSTAFLEKEIQSFPEDRKRLLNRYTWLLARVRKDEAHALVEKEIEEQLKGGLWTEDDYILLEQLYKNINLPEQQKVITALKKDKYFNGKWFADQTQDEFYSEPDPEKAKLIMNKILENIESFVSWKHLKSQVASYPFWIAYKYAQKQEWEKARAYVHSITDPYYVNSVYTIFGWNIYNNYTKDFKDAEPFLREMMLYWKNKKGFVSEGYLLTEKEKEKMLAGNYMRSLHAYAQALLAKGEHQKGLEIEKEAIDLSISLNKQPDNKFVTVFAQLAEKGNLMKLQKHRIEGYVKAGAGTEEVKKILRAQYIKERGSDKYFEKYYSLLEKDGELRQKENLRKLMLHEDAPSFTVKDINGNSFTKDQLKGKVTLIDFWATWCTPCLQSFPALDKFVSSYKEQNDVAFIFLNTMEKGDQLQVVKDFIANSEYAFPVMLDEGRTTYDAFNITWGIPTKVVLDKNGIVRFKHTGYDGNDSKLEADLKQMIELALEASK